MSKRQSFNANQAAPSFDWGPTPTADATLPAGCRSLYFNAAGSVELQGSDGTNRIFVVQASQTLACGPAMIVGAGTTVAMTDIIPLY